MRILLYIIALLNSIEPLTYTALFLYLHCLYTCTYGDRNGYRILIEPASHLAYFQG
jgi:hypothetical protein